MDINSRAELLSNSLLSETLCTFTYEEQCYIIDICCSDITALPAFLSAENHLHFQFAESAT